MAKLQLEIPDVDLTRFKEQAHREGKTLNEWLLDAAHARPGVRRQVETFESPEDVREFFRVCDTLEGPGTEPDWSEHLRTIGQSRTTGITGT